MKLSDLLSISTMLPAVSLGRLATLREALDREGSSPSLQTASALREPRAVRRTMPCAPSWGVSSSPAAKAPACLSKGRPAQANPTC